MSIYYFFVTHTPSVVESSGGELNTDRKRQPPPIPQSVVQRTSHRLLPTPNDSTRTLDRQPPTSNGNIRLSHYRPPPPPLPPSTGDGDQSTSLRSPPPVPARNRHT